MFIKKYALIVASLFLFITIALTITHANTLVIYIFGFLSLVLFVRGLLRKPEAKKLSIQDFIVTFTSFRVNLDTNANVYQALVEAQKGATPKLQKPLAELITLIADDHSVQPFFRFANYFDNKIIMHVMVNIFLLINHGVDSRRLWQFNYTFEKIYEMNLTEMVENHQSSYEQFNIMLYVGTGIVIATLMLNITALISGGLYG